MKIGYFVNQYPKVSHTFIRREILALERAGVQVLRYALRGWDAEVVDGLDENEKAKTRFILRSGIGPLVAATVRQFLRSPSALARAMTAAWRQWRGGDRTLAYNVVSVMEACVLVEWCRSDGVTHVHAHFGTNSALIVRFAHLLEGPSYSFAVHGPDEFDSPRELGLKAKIGEAAFVAAISQFTRAQLQRWSRLEDRQRIHVVRCGLDAAFLDQHVTPPPDNARLVCIGRLCAEKGQLLLVEAVAALAKRGRVVDLVLAGDGDDRGAIEDAIAHHELQARVTLLGWVDEANVRAQILAARALVLPSRMEGLPMVLMEALAMSRPVISTFVAGIPELVHQAQAGWLFPAGDRQALESALEECLDATADELVAMAERGKRAVLERHSVDTEGRRLMKLFQEIS